MEKTGMDKLVAGVSNFRRDVFPRHSELFEALSGGQEPETLFLTCSDSRIDPSLITQALPGDLFICRNAGNIVPPHVQDAGGVTATIEFAVVGLDVRHIVVCGHSDCGAVKGAMNLGALDKMPHVRRWLAQVEAAVRVVKARDHDKDEHEQVRILTEENVLLQLQHLRTHPCVAEGVATGELSLHGWVYDIGSGAVRAWDEAAQAFLPLADAHADAGLPETRRAAR